MQHYGKNSSSYTVATLYDPITKIYRGKVVFLYDTNAYKVNRNLAPHILNLVARWKLLVNTTPWPLAPGEIIRVRTE
jgi:hypothetical protein